MKRYKNRQCSQKKNRKEERFLPNVNNFNKFNNYLAVENDSYQVASKYRQNFVLFVLRNF